MGYPSSVNDQITDAVARAHAVGGDDALAVISTLMSEIASCLAEARHGHTTMEALSVAIENAEVALHDIVARLAGGAA